MARTKLLIGAFLLSTAIASPAWAAGDACDLNGSTSPNLTIFDGQLYCGVLSSYAQAPNQTAVGDKTSISSNDSTTVGALSLAGGEGATALGESAWSDLLGVFFSGTLPTGATSTALGQAAISAGAGTLAVGDHSFVGLLDGPQINPVQDATALGSNSAVTANNATAVGFGSSATAASATALGQGASATAANSVAIGAGSVADQANTVSVGAVGDERRITNVAAGVNPTDAVNVSQLQSVTGDISGLQVSVDANTADIAANTADIADLQSGLADTNAALDSLSNRVDALEAVTSDIDQRIGRVQRRADAGTATAVALSGAVFLPDKTFDLTANVGTYHGAVAGALQFGAVVSQHVAVNGGIASGFNKGGKLAARAGLTFGW